MKTLEVLSGSRENLTASHNRFGYYFRKRSTPVNPRTSFQEVVRANQSANAALWRTLTDVQRAGWESLGAMMQRTDPLGRTYTFNGILAFCSVNNNKRLAGDAAVLDAPALITPDAVATLVLTITLGTPNVIDLAFTPTPAGAANRLFIYATPPLSAGRAFANSYRLLSVTAVNIASPIHLVTPYQARFGAPAVGTRVAVRVALYDGGFVGQPKTINAIAE